MITGSKKFLSKIIVNKALSFFNIKEKLIIEIFASWNVKFIHPNNIILQISIKLIIIIDIYKMYLERFPLSNRSASLDNICKMFQIDLSERINNGHGALLDARLAADCYEKISNQ